MVKKTDYLLKIKWIAVKKNTVIMLTRKEVANFHILVYLKWLNVIAINGYRTSIYTAFRWRVMRFV